MELLNAIGFVYAAKAKQFLASNQSFLGVGGWLHNVQGKYHVFSETCVSVITFSGPRFLSLTPYSVSTLRSAIELKAVFDQIQQAEQSGTLSAEEKKRLEEQAAEKGLQALFKVRLSSHRIFRLFPVQNVHTYVVLIIIKIGRKIGDRLGAARDV